MEVYLSPDRWAKLYNCSGLTFEEWSKFGREDLITGFSLIILGLVLEMVYLPFLITMLQPKFFKLSCYKLMFFLGVLDVLTTFFSAFGSGYFLTQGAVFCTHPNIIYMCGLFGTISWKGSCAICIILTINRCADIYFPKLAQYFFGGHRIWFWLLFPFLLMIRNFIYGIPSIFNSSLYGWFFYPYYGTGITYGNRLETMDYYNNMGHTINNIVTIIVLSIGNFLLVNYVLSTYRKMFYQNTKSYVRKRQFLLQIIVICTLTTICSTIYVYMQFFFTPTWLIFIGTLTLILRNGALGFIYLFLNPTLRHAASEFYFNVKPENRNRKCIAMKVLYGSKSALILRNSDMLFLTSKYEGCSTITS